MGFSTHPYVPPKWYFLFSKLLGYVVLRQLASDCMVGQSGSLTNSIRRLLVLRQFNSTRGGTNSYESVSPDSIPSKLRSIGQLPLRFRVHYCTTDKHFVCSASQSFYFCFRRLIVPIYTCYKAVVARSIDSKRL
jgi:hypothetical protein